MTQNDPIRTASQLQDELTAAMNVPFRTASHMLHDELTAAMNAPMKALQDITEAVAVMEDEIKRLRIDRNEWREDAEWERKVSDSLREERDAARREVCYCHPESAQFAINRGWDCFKTKEETQ
jgi:hypothetical protein